MLAHSKKTPCDLFYAFAAWIAVILIPIQSSYASDTFVPQYLRDTPQTNPSSPANDLAPLNAAMLAQLPIGALPASIESMSPQKPDPSLTPLETTTGGEKITTPSPSQLITDINTIQSLVAQTKLPETPTKSVEAKEISTDKNIPPDSTHVIPENEEPKLNLSTSKNGMVSMEMKNADLMNVVQLLAQSAGLNIIVPDGLAGKISLSLKDVYWEDALSSILRTKGFAYEKRGNVVRIDVAQNIQTDLISKIFTLQYIDAEEIKPLLATVLTPVGKVTSFIEKGRSSYALKGEMGERKMTEGGVSEKARSLVVTDVVAGIERAEKAIRELDVQPKQISIEVQLVEVTHSEGEQIGVNWNFELSAAGGKQPMTFPFPAAAVGGPFLPSNTDFPQTESNDFTFGALDASNFKATLQMMQTNGQINVLSSPKITTLSNLEASILIGEHFPITTESIDAETGLRTITLDHYEDIGIQLIVIPKIVGDNTINMIIHPAVSSLGDLVDGRYPRINTREADTQVMIANANTIVIGGLLQDREIENLRKVPFLGDIPILKYLFRHKEKSTQKIELMIFVTPRIVGATTSPSLPESLSREVSINALPETVMKKVDKSLGLNADNTKKEGSENKGTHKYRGRGR